MVFGVEYQVFKIWLALLTIFIVGAIDIRSLVFGGVSLLGMVGVLIFLRELSKDDACTRQKYLRYWHQSNVYEPWPQVRQEGISGQIHPRPLGFGRNRLV